MSQNHMRRLHAEWQNVRSRRDFLVRVASYFLARSDPAEAPEPRIDWETAYPRRAEATYRLIDGGGVEMYDRERLSGLPYRYRLNPVAQMIWDSCTGQYNVAQIARTLAHAFRMDVATCLQDTVRFLDEMHRLGALTLSSEASAEPLFDIVLSSGGPVSTIDEDENIED